MKISIVQIILLALIPLFIFQYFQGKDQIKVLKNQLGKTEGYIESVYLGRGEDDNKYGVISFADSLGSEYQFVSAISNRSIGSLVTVYYGEGIAKTFIGQTERQETVGPLVFAGFCLFFFFILMMGGKNNKNSPIPFILFGVFLFIGTFLTYYFMVKLPNEENNKRDKETIGKIVEIVTNKRKRPYSIVQFHHKGLNADILFASSHLGLTRSKIKVHYYSNSNTGAILHQKSVSKNDMIAFLVFVISIGLLLIKNNSHLGEYLTKRKIL
jgi:hypothetical protein